MKELNLEVVELDLSFNVFVDLRNLGMRGVLISFSLRLDTQDASETYVDGLAGGGGVGGGVGFKKPVLNCDDKVVVSNWLGGLGSILF